MERPLAQRESRVGLGDGAGMLEARRCSCSVRNSPPGGDLISLCKRLKRTKGKCLVVIVHGLSERG